MRSCRRVLFLAPNRIFILLIPTRVRIIIFRYTRPLVPQVSDMVMLSEDLTNSKTERDKEEMEASKNAAGSDTAASDDLKSEWSFSDKIQQLVSDLKELQITDSGVSSGLGKVKPRKVVVFSQWTHMLDIVECALQEEGGGIPFRRLDGGMSQVAREAALLDFEKKGEVLVMLISLKAGGVGLNLVAASVVILLDPWSVLCFWCWLPFFRFLIFLSTHSLHSLDKAHVSFAMQVESGCGRTGDWACTPHRTNPGRSGKKVYRQRNGGRKNPCHAST